MLETIENLFEGELHTREHAAMTSRNAIGTGCPTGERQQRYSGRDQDWKVSDDQAQSENSAHDAASSRGDATQSDASCTTGRNVRIEAHDRSRWVDRQNGRGNLPCIDQIVSSPADVDCSLEFAEQSPLRLPGDAVGEPSLHLKALIALHPAVDRR
ncbi:MAG TPA: hypothetical protein VGP15_08285, partial [Burkholderiales bacterium]|nr:hypothetical protein [Burkholderiales bacterium]